TGGHGRAGRGSSGPAATARSSGAGKRERRRHHGPPWWSGARRPLTVRLDMNGWQDIVALSCVALAAAYVLWRVVRKVFKRTGSACGGCSNCETGEVGTGPTQLVSLAPPKSGKPAE